MENKALHSQGQGLDEYTFGREAAKNRSRPSTFCLAGEIPKGDRMNSVENNLAYFTEWGGRNWVDLAKLAVSELQKDDGLKGAELLDVGSRYGKMAVFFSLIGAKVTGIDICEEFVLAAREEAKKWNAPNVNFIQYNGNWDMIPDESFDIVFTKSVLVMVPDLEDLLRNIAKKLRPNGRVAFLENGKGDPLFHMLRRITRRKFNWRRRTYITRNQVKLIQSMFEITSIKRTFFPPIYLFLGRKRSSACQGACSG